MTIPQSLTWQHKVNLFIPTSASADACRTIWYQWKTALTTFALAPWTVVGSSDGTTAGMDGVDRWTSPLSLGIVASTGNRGWIVLGCPTTGAQVLVSLVVFDTSFASSIVFKLSPGGLYTGGTTSADPTATDEIIILNAADTQFYGKVHETAAVRSYHLNVMRSTGGEATMWSLGHIEAGATAVGYIGRLEGARYPNSFGAMLMATAHKVGNNVLTLPAVFDQSTGTTSAKECIGTAHRAYFGKLPTIGSSKMFLTAPGASIRNLYSTTIQTRFPLGSTDAQSVGSENQLVREYDFPSVGCYCSQSGYRGTHGKLYDMRWAADTISQGTTFGANGEWVKMGPLLMPWNGKLANF